MFKIFKCDNKNYFLSIFSFLESNITINNTTRWCGVNGTQKMVVEISKMISEKNQLISRLMGQVEKKIPLQRVEKKIPLQRENKKTSPDDVNTDLDAIVFERDLLEDSFNFAFDHGLGSKAVAEFVQFFQTLLKDTVKKGMK